MPPPVFCLSLEEFTILLLPLLFSLPAVGAAAWARRVLQPAVPPRRLPQSASSLNASHQSLEAPATFPRPSPTLCSWPGPWQSPYGPAPLYAGCPLLMAGPGSGPGGGKGPAPHAWLGESKWGPSLSPESLVNTQWMQPPPRWGTWRRKARLGPRVRGALFPLSKCVRINKTHVASVQNDLSLLIASPHPLPSLPISFPAASALPCLSLGYSLWNSTLRGGFELGWGIWKEGLWWWGPDVKGPAGVPMSRQWRAAGLRTV